MLLKKRKFSLLGFYFLMVIMIFSGMIHFFALLCSFKSFFWFKNNCFIPFITGLQLPFHIFHYILYHNYTKRYCMVRCHSTQCRVFFCICCFLGNKEKQSEDRQRSVFGGGVIGKLTYRYVAYVHLRLYDEIFF